MQGAIASNMAESNEVLLARIDERTKATHEDVQEFRVEQRKQQKEIDSLKQWRSGLAGAFTLLTVLIALISAFGG